MFCNLELTSLPTSTFQIKISKILKYTSLLTLITTSFALGMHNENNSENITFNNHQNSHPDKEKFLSLKNSIFECLAYLSPQDKTAIVETIFPSFENNLPKRENTTSIPLAYLGHMANDPESLESSFVYALVKDQRKKFPNFLNPVIPRISVTTIKDMLKMIKDDPEKLRQLSPDSFSDFSDDTIKKDIERVSRDVNSLIEELGNLHYPQFWTLPSIPIHYPKNWCLTEMGIKNIFSLSKNSPELNDLCKELGFQDNGQEKIMRIVNPSLETETIWQVVGGDKIQNLYHYLMYECEKNNILQKFPKSLTKTIERRLLSNSIFDPDSEIFLKEILNHGIDPRRQENYCAFFEPSTQNFFESINLEDGEKVSVLLCRVLTGRERDIQDINSDIIKPIVLSSGIIYGAPYYHSVVDVEEDTWTIFNGYQILPEYVLHCKKTTKKIDIDDDKKDMQENSTESIAHSSFIPPLTELVMSKIIKLLKEAPDDIKIEIFNNIKNTSIAPFNADSNIYTDFMTIEIPKTWESQQDNDQFFYVDLQTPEYSNVIKRLNQVPGFSVDKVVRIQNPFWYKMYEIKKREIENKWKNAYPERLIEDHFFTHVQENRFDAVQYGAYLEPHLVKKEAELGRGIYFSKDPTSYKKGDRFSVALCKTLIGKVCEGIGKPGLQRPPQPPKETEIADSISGLASPYKGADKVEMTVIFDKYQFYPEYVITFQKDK